jgi:hypothetical protein
VSRKTLGISSQLTGGAFGYRLALFGVSNYSRNCREGLKKGVTHRDSKPAKARPFFSFRIISELM